MYPAGRRAYIYKYVAQYRVGDEGVSQKVGVGDTYICIVR